MVRFAGRVNPHSILAYTGICSVAPIYTSLWMSCRLATLALPSRYYTAMDDALYASYQMYIQMFFELYTGVKVVFHGDRPRDENAVCVMNHQCTTDWFIFDMLGGPVGCVGRIRYMLKDTLRLLPFYGWYFEQHGGLYVGKNWGRDEKRLSRALSLVQAAATPQWLVIFPEGTRFTPGPEPGVGPGLTEVKAPKSKGFAGCVNLLRGHTQAVYDLTVAYAVDGTGRRPPDVNMESMMNGELTEIHIHLRRTELDQLPTEPNALGGWLDDQFVTKDAMLRDFRRGGGFPGGETWVSDPPVGTIIAHSAFWAGLTALSFGTEAGRKLYGYQLLVGGVMGIVLGYVQIQRGKRDDL